MSNNLLTEVLIIGAGPSGMVSALCLAQAGIRCVVVERAKGISVHPKAHELNARSIEILMGLGFSLDELQQEASPQEDASRVCFCNSLDKEYGRIDLMEDKHNPEKYVEHLRAAQPYLNVSQTEVERLMLEHLQQAKGVTLLFEHQWEGLVEEGGVVTSQIRRRSDDTVLPLSSKYVLAADGASSRVRKHLNIAMEGPEKLQDFVNAYLEMDLSQHVSARAKLYWLFHPEAPGTLIAHFVEKRWVYHIPIYPPYEKVEDYTEDVFKERIRTVLGEDVPVTIRSISYWRMTAQIARQFRSGPVFLVGDAAHRFPPTGGLGMNTGIADAHNISWKLAAVLRGKAHNDLLETYEQERRPVAEKNCQESLDNYNKMFDVVKVLGMSKDGLEQLARLKKAFSWLPRSWQKTLHKVLMIPAYRMLAKFDRNPEAQRKMKKVIDEQAPHFDRIGLDIGYIYQEGALVSDNSEPIPQEVSSYTPTAQPGARFPHIWLDKDHTLSSHDIFDTTGYTLLLDNNGDKWKEALHSIESLQTTIAIKEMEKCCHNDKLPNFRKLCEVQEDGALLIRPDGHVACRFKAITNNPIETLERVFRECYIQ